MPWLSMGRLQLSWDWQTVNLPDVNGNQYRIIQTYRKGLIYPSGYFLFGWLCVDAGIYGVRKIWLSDRPTLFSSPVPDSLASVCLTRYATFKLPSRARIDPQNPWTVEIQDYTPNPVES